MDRSEQAAECHGHGYNCAQAVLLAFVDKTGLAHDQCARLTAGLGGGVGQLRELAERFERDAGSLRCGELLNLSGRGDTMPPLEQRPCDRLIREAVRCLEEALDVYNRDA